MKSLILEIYKSPYSRGLFTSSVIVAICILFLKENFVYGILGSIIYEVHTIRHKLSQLQCPCETESIE